MPMPAKKQDRLTTPERMGALMMGQKPDRVAFVPFIFGYCAKNVGYPVAAVYEDAEKSFFSQLWTAEMYGYDASPLYAYASYGGWEWGGEIKMPKSQWEQAPVVSRFPVETEKDVDELAMPDVEKAGCLPIAMAFSRLQQKFGMPITIPAPGVFTEAGNICEVNRLCKWMMKRPEVAHKLLRKVLSHNVDLVKHWVKTFGVQTLQPFTGEATAANQVISAKQFEDFVLPYQKEYHEKMFDMGIKSVFCHICGEQNANLPHWKKIPFGVDGVPGVLSFGHEVDLDTAIAYFGRENIIAGNIEPSVIQNGTAQQVYNLCQVAIEKGKKSPHGYVLMAGCEVPVQAPPYNIYIMKKAVMDCGFYD